MRPDEFIPLAEETGLILPIGDQVIAQVVDQAAAWGGKIKLSINLSTRQFGDPTLAERLMSSAQAAGISGEALGLEITETTLMTDFDVHVAAMERLGTQGVRFSIDDFGTGYSSLAYLRRIPLDCLKIDRSFTAEILESEDARSIVSATIAMAHSLRLGVVAEGVETAQQAQLLREMKADTLQGFYFGRPVSAADFAATFLP